MHLLWTPLFVAFTLLFSSLTIRAQSLSPYFVVNQPGASSSWKNGSPYPVTWTKGLLDGVNSFDLEIARLNTDGLYYVARNVPAKPSVLNVLLENVPEGDDYFVLCLNSTGGVTYAVSSRFSVVSSSSSASQPSPHASAPTVTISGIPNSMQQFSRTFGPSQNGVVAPGIQGLTSVGIAMGAIILGGVLTVW